MISYSFVLVSCLSVVMGVGLSFADGLFDAGRAWLSVLAVVLIHAFWETYVRRLNLNNLSKPSLGPGFRLWSIRDTLLAGVLLLTGMGVSFILVLESVWILAVVLGAGFLAGFVAGMDRLCYGPTWRQLFFTVFCVGPVCLAGSYFAVSLEINHAVVVAGLIPGLFALNFCLLTEPAAQDAWHIFCGRFFIVLAGLMLLPVVIHLMTEDHLNSLYASCIPALFLPFFFRALSMPSPHIFSQTRRLWLTCDLLYTAIFLAGWIM